MKTLIIVIIILLAVLSTPLSLKKLIDRSKVTEKAKGGLSEWIDDPLLNGSALAEKEEEGAETAAEEGALEAAPAGEETAALDEGAAALEADDAEEDTDDE